MLERSVTEWRTSSSLAEESSSLEGLGERREGRRGSGKERGKEGGEGSHPIIAIDGGIECEKERKGIHLQREVFFFT